jgi:prepilin-type processing-associated H-X9-DG protein
LNYTQNGQPWGLSVGGTNLQKWNLGELVNPSPVRALTFIDWHADYGDTAEFINLFPQYFSTPGWIDLPGEHHGGGANLAFADGHIEHWHWRWSRPGKYAGQVPVPVANNNDLYDLLRLADIFPKP